MPRLTTFSFSDTIQSETASQPPITQCEKHAIHQIQEVQSLPTFSCRNKTVDNASTITTSHIHQTLPDRFATIMGASFSTIIEMESATINSTLPTYVAITSLALRSFDEN